MNELDLKVLEIIRKHANITKDDLYVFNEKIKVFDVFIDEVKNKEDFEIVESWLHYEPRNEKI